jgi:hypothetical protein
MSLRELGRPFNTFHLSSKLPLYSNIALKATIQQWIRGPSMSIYLFIAFTAWYNGKISHMSTPVVRCSPTFLFVAPCSVAVDRIV